MRDAKLRRLERRSRLLRHQIQQREALTVSELMLKVFSTAAYNSTPKTDGAQLVLRDAIQAYATVRGSLVEGLDQTSDEALFEILRDGIQEIIDEMAENIDRVREGATGLAKAARAAGNGQKMTIQPVLK